MFKHTLGCRVFALILLFSIQQSRGALSNIPDTTNNSHFSFTRTYFTISFELLFLYSRRVEKKISSTLIKADISPSRHAVFIIKQGVKISI